MSHSKDHPFSAILLNRYRLNGEGSDKYTYHLELDLNGSGIQYRAGDSFGIYPQNSPEAVEQILSIFPGTADNLVQIEKKGIEGTFTHLLTHHLNLRDVSKKLALAIAEHSSNDLKEICQDRALCKDHLAQFEVWDFLSHYSHKLSPQELVDLLPPLLPRFYSIASSQQVVGNSVHLTIADVQYDTRGIRRRGVCTDFLLRQAIVGETAIPLYLQPTKDFLLPVDHTTPIIMVGPGTGIAPFRAFAQQRQADQAPGKQWLFFGERSQSCDFLYEQEWKNQVEKGILTLQTAFSRDQENKIYVQDRIRENGQEIWNWLENGAHFYVCGDASRMAKDVEHTLGEIVSTYGGQDSKAYIKELRRSKRYLRDVY